MRQKGEGWFISRHGVLGAGTLTSINLMNVKSLPKRLSFWVYSTVIELFVLCIVVAIILDEPAAGVLTWITMSAINILGWYLVWRVCEKDLRKGGWRW